MKKIILILAIVAISTVQAKTQGVKGNTGISIGAEVGAPVGTAGISDYYSLVVGGSIQAEHLVSPDFGLTLKAGYLHYLAKAAGLGAGFIPVLAGFRYHFSPMVYASGQLGASFSTLSGSGISFSYAPGVGFMFAHHIDVLARYEAASKSGLTFGNIGVRMAYNFN
ncbi:MAG: outer membrane beta-barrel protein [Ginsengibacter sp.]